MTCDQSTTSTENTHRYSSRSCYRDSSTNHATNLPLCWPVTKIANVNESLPIAMNRLCKKLCAPNSVILWPYKPAAEPGGFAEQAWGGQRADVARNGQMWRLAAADSISLCPSGAPLHKYYLHCPLHRIIGFGPLR